MMLVSNFKIDLGRELGAPGVISWDYISIPNGIEIPKGSVQWADPEGEIFVAIDATNQVILTGTVGPTDLALAWLNGSDTFSTYFYNADFPPAYKPASQFKLPNTRTQKNPVDFFKGINPEDLSESFHYQGCNFPGPGAGSGITASTPVIYKGEFPGWEFAPIGHPDAKVPGLGSQELNLEALILDEFSEGLKFVEQRIKNYWTSYLAPDSGNIDVWGLSRDHWAKICQLAPGLKKHFLMATVPAKKSYPSLKVWVGTEPGSVSVDDPGHWKWGSVVNAPANYGVEVFSYENGALLYEATPSIEGLSSTAGPITVQWGPDSYEPEIDLRNLIPNQFVRGYTYSWDTSQALPGFPPGFIVLAPGRGRYPRNSALTLNNAQYFNQKLNTQSLYHAFDLAKLSSKVLAQPLRLWRLSPLTVELGSNVFEADAVLGHDDNRVCVRLPKFYTRDSLLWKLAQEISSAFLPIGTYEIGYDQFMADLSVAEEPIFELDAVNITAQLEAGLPLSANFQPLQELTAVYDNNFAPINNQPSVLENYNQVANQQPVFLELIQNP
jgi:hypothetical protein